MRVKSSWPKYRDFEGHFSVDFLDLNGEERLLKLLEVNRDEYYLIGIEFGTATIRGVESTFHVTALCLDRTRYPGFDSAVAEISKNGGIADVEEFSTTLNFEEFFSLFKRFGGMLYRKGIANHIEEIITPDLDDLEA